MTIYPIDIGQPVEFEFAGRTLEGIVEDIRWKPSFNNQTHEIVVDANGTTITTGRTSIRR